MRVYRLLIVEDEVWEREGLLSFIDWSELNIEVVGTAVNGIQGLQMAKENLPNIIIADIRMPKMDGLELTAAVKHFLPDCRIILITGYDDFKYAKEAIHMGVSDYLLKPVQKGQLLDALNKVLSWLHQNNQEEAYTDMLQTQLTERFYGERERVLLDILKGKEYSPETVEKMPFKLDFSKTIAIVIRMSGFPITLQNDCCGMQQIRSFYKIIRKIVGKRGLTAVNDSRKGEIIICLSLKHEGRGEIDNILLQILQGDYDEDSPEYVIGVGLLSNTASDFIVSFIKAQCALELLFFIKDSQVIYYEDCQQQEGTQESSVCNFLYSAPNYTKRLLNGIISKTSEEVTALTEEFFDFITSQTVPKSLVCDYLANFINELSILLSPNKEATNPVINIGEDIPGAFQTSIKLEQLKVWIHSLLLQTNMFFVQTRKNKEEYIMDNAMDIINNEYSQCIGLEVIARRLEVSPNYLGNLFKQYKGKCFTKVLMELRMGKAEKRLVSSPEQIKNIAQGVGFSNASYFCTVFKKYHGISPMDFREKYGCEKEKEELYK